MNGILLQESVMMFNMIYMNYGYEYKEIAENSDLCSLHLKRNTFTFKVENFLR
jgi:hypothetical protein